MKSPLITLFTGLVLSVPAWAREHRPRGPHHFGPRGEACAELKLSDAQKTQLRDAHLKFEEERIDLEARERHARLDLKKLLSAKDADVKAIRKAAQAAAEATAKIRIAEDVQRTEVVLSVFKPEQREEAMRCAHDFGPRFVDPHGPPPPEPAAAPGDDDQTE